MSTKRQLSIPEGFDLMETADLTTIRRVWFSRFLLPLFFFCLFWDGMVIFFFYVSTFKKATFGAMLFSLPFVAAGLGLTYFCIALFFNKTDIECNIMGVRVCSYPIPWSGNRLVRADGIMDLVVRERGASGRRDGGMAKYAIMYVDRMNKERELVGGLFEHHEADFIARTLRRTLNLPRHEEESQR